MGLREDADRIVRESIRKVLERTIQVDSRMSQRVAGKDSFYK